MHTLTPLLLALLLVLPATSWSQKNKALSKIIMKSITLPKKQNFLKIRPKTVSSPTLVNTEAAPAVIPEKILQEQLILATQQDLNLSRSFQDRTAVMDQITQLLQAEPDPVLALRLLRQYQPAENPAILFEHFALQYYQGHMRPTNTTHELIHKIASLKNPNIEEQTLARLEYLFKKKVLFWNAYLQQTGNHPFHAKDITTMTDYIGNLFLITPENFNPAKIVFRYENELAHSSELSHIEHVNAQSALSIQGVEYPVVNFSADLMHLWDLYQYLIDGRQKQSKLTVITNTNATKLLIYNENKNIWVRADRHEYKNPKKLHVHLSQRLPLHLSGPNFRQEEVIHSLRIAVKTPSEHPAQISPKQLAYNFVLQPFMELKNDPRVRIIVTKSMPLTTR